MKEKKERKKQHTLLCRSKRGKCIHEASM